MSQLQYTREVMRSVKEALKRSHLWSAYYFTNRKGRWYPPTVATKTTEAYSADMVNSSDVEN